MSDESFIGKQKMEIESHTVEARTGFLNFKAYQRAGLTALSAPDPETPLRGRDSLHAGMDLYFPHPFSGGYWKVTVSNDLLSAESETLYVSLGYDEHDQEWVGMSFGSKAALERINFD